jgi:glycosyltransferase involved in cell wall biosynthesis
VFKSHSRDFIFKKVRVLQKTGLSIVVPTLDEGLTIGKFIRKLLSMKECGRAQIIVVDGGSGDNTRDEVLAISKRAKNVEFAEAPPGKAMGLRIGFSKAKGKNIIFIDADFQYSPDDIPKITRALKSADLVVTKRITNGFSHRRLLSLGFSQIIGKGLLNLPASDPQSGLKGIRSSLLKRIALASRHWEMDAELISKAQAAGAKIKEIEIGFHPRLAGRTKTGVAGTSANLLAGALSVAAGRR